MAKLDVTIDSRRWKLVRDLRRYGPRDRVYTLRKAADGKSVLAFGDGRSGIRLPKGGTIRVQYRTGSGTAVSLEQSLRRRMQDIVIWLVTHHKTAAIGIDHHRNKKVTDPVPAVGGREREELEEARKQAPSLIHDRKNPRSRTKRRDTLEVGRQGLERKRGR